MQTRTVLVDDHTLVRAGLRSLLESIAGVDVVAEAGDGYAALELVKIHNPDVVILDIAMPNMNGLEATMRIKKEFPQVLVIMLSMHTSKEYVRQALKAGASGYLVKDSAPLELERALLTVRRGERYLSPQISEQALEDYIDSSPHLDESAGKLTPRQREVLQLIAEGYSTKKIAQRLKLSTKTIETHRTQLMERINIKDVAGLVRYAVRTGLIIVDKQ